MQSLSTPYKVDVQFAEDPIARDRFRWEAKQMHQRNGGEVQLWIEFLFPEGRIFGEIIGRCENQSLPNAHSQPDLSKSEVRALIQQRKETLVRKGGKAKALVQILSDAY